MGDLDGLARAEADIPGAPAGDITAQEVAHAQQVWFAMVHARARIVGSSRHDTGPGQSRSLDNDQLDQRTVRRRGKPWSG